MEQFQWSINANYDSGTYNTELLKSNLCDFNDAYILIRGDVIVKGHL